MTEDERVASEFSEPTVEEGNVLPQRQYVIGVGGCGNNLIDAILLRKDSKQNREDMPKERWNQIMAGQAMINSNMAELADSYYFAEVKNQEAGIAANQHAFGQHGAGYDWEKAKNMLIDHLNSDSWWDDLWGDDLQSSRIERANSIWLLHSAVGGTGAGATPQFARALRDSLRNQHRTPIISFPVLSGSPDLRNQEDCNTLAGLSSLSETVEAIIPMSNKQLRTLENSDLLDIEYDDKNTVFTEENQGIITFLELMGGSLTSGQHFGQHIDISDIYSPINQYYPASEETPAPILAPVIKKSTMDDLDNHLEITISDLFEQGKLIEFNPSTAWGVSLVFCGPPDQIENIIDKTRHHQVSNLVRDHLYSEKEQSTGPFVQTYRVGLSGLDDFWLIAFVANPEIPEINRAYKMAEQYKTSDTPVGEGLENNWGLIDNLVNVLQSEPSELID